MAEDRLIIADDDRYQRLRLISWWDQRKLAAARVLVVGAGALGNEVLKNLALLGAGHVYIVDCDRIEVSNLTRSLLFRQRDCGRLKAEVAAEAIRDLNPDTRAVPVAGNVLTDVGLGLVRDVDVVIACLDNRQSRLWLNRCCWKTGTPWIDGAIQELDGVVKVFQPPDSACYECTMTDNDYRLVNLRYRCPLLRPEHLQEGKVPTTPTIASMIGGLQTQEAVKIIHGKPVAAGTAHVFNGVANRLYSTRLPRRGDCLSHEPQLEPVELPRSSARGTAAELFQAAAARLGSGPLELVLDRELLVQLHCHRCGWHQRVMKPLVLADAVPRQCPACHELVRPEIEHVIAADSPLARQPLTALGVPPYDIVRLRRNGEETAFLLAADRPAVLGTSLPLVV